MLVCFFPINLSYLIRDLEHRTWAVSTLGSGALGPLFCCEATTSFTVPERKTSYSDRLALLLIHRCRFWYWARNGNHPPATCAAAVARSASAAWSRARAHKDAEHGRCCRAAVAASPHATALGSHLASDTPTPRLLLNPADSQTPNPRAVDHRVRAHVPCRHTR